MTPCLSAPLATAPASRQRPGLLAALLAATALPSHAQAITGASFNGADTAWVLICTVLVLLMTVPGLMLFYSGMLRNKNALSVVAHLFSATAVVTLAWVAVGYSIAFTPGNGFFGGLERALGDGLIGPKVLAHPLAPTVPESAFALFQMAFAIITFCIIFGATAERLRLSATICLAGLWTALVYAPIAHWVWHPAGWLAAMGHMDFAGGTVVHIAAGGAGLAAAAFVGPRIGFGKEPFVPHSILTTVIGAGLLWAGWFGFNAGSAFEASSRAVGAVLATQVAAATAAFVWGLCEFALRGQFSVLGMATGAIAGLIAVTPASGYVGPFGALCIGAVAAVACFACVTHFKSRTRIDDSLDVFALHGVGGLVGTVLVPVFALKEIAPVTATVLTNLIGAAAVLGYSFAATWVLFWIIKPISGIRVTPKDELAGLDISQHGEMADGA